MKISEINQHKPILQTVDQTHSAKSNEKIQKPGQVAPDSPSGDRVEFSSRSKEMQKIYETLKNTPEVRSEKVDDLKNRINKGQYQVDSEAIAEKIIKESILDLI